MNRIEQRLMESPSFRDFFADYERSRQRVELEKIAANPVAHRDTTLMSDRGLRYRYYEVKTGKTTRVRFAWATTPNAAGYYLTWTETIDSRGNGERKFIRGHERRRDAKESALKGYENLCRERGERT